MVIYGQIRDVARTRMRMQAGVCTVQDLDDQWDAVDDYRGPVDNPWMPACRDQPARLVCVDLLTMTG